jgi:hypothetical protein
VTFLAMINDLRLSGDSLKDMWKYADDTTISEVIPRFGNSADLIKVPIWSDQNKLHLHPAKCKEVIRTLRTGTFTVTL